MPNPHKYCILGKKANLVGNTFSAYSKSSSNVTPRPFNTRPCIKATVDCVSIYKACNPNFIYAPSHNPRRVLTKPSDGVLNEGHDNQNGDLIIYVNDALGSTFGQVVKCYSEKFQSHVAVKVIKNKPAYYNQALMEVKILEVLNQKADPQDKYHLVRLIDVFHHRHHLCLAFELLSVNLYDLIKQNSFRGVSLSLVQRFVKQVVNSLTILNKHNIIHCDLKPENVLLESLSSPRVKVIDFGSACFENKTVYSYIQSRFYRSPEVLLGCTYACKIDVWSLGCIAAELFLGIPIFPGASELNQVERIIEMIGEMPHHMIVSGERASRFYNITDKGTHKTVQIKDKVQYAKDMKASIPHYKNYFNYKTLPEIIDNYSFKRGISRKEFEREMKQRAIFKDFLFGLLCLDPEKRWSALQASAHPFVTGAAWTGPFTPPSDSDLERRQIIADLQQSFPSVTPTKSA